MKIPASTTRMRLPMGPVTLAEMAIAVVFGRQLPLPEAFARSPQVTRTRVRIPAAARLTPPEPAWLLDQAGRLELSRSQQDRLARLEIRWKRETRALHQELNRASQEFRNIADAAGEKQAGLLVLQERAAPVSVLSGQLLSARQGWWNEASRELSAGQRQQAETFRAGRFAQHAPAQVTLP